MKKYIKILTVLAVSAGFVSSAVAAAPKNDTPTTRGDAVIFKVHDIVPVDNNGVVTGCDFTLSLYNRTSINFRNFTLNLNWEDSVDERFHFDRYMATIMKPEDLNKQADALPAEETAKPLSTAITINAFGANKHLSVKSHIDNEKCYLLLREAKFSVTPCDIARGADNAAAFNLGDKGKECTALFQFVSTDNPEYFGQFKDTSATELALQSQSEQNKELTEVDIVLNKIIENMGISDKTLSNIH